MILTRILADLVLQLFQVDFHSRRFPDIRPKMVACSLITSGQKVKFKFRQRFFPDYFVSGLIIKKATFYPESWPNPLGPPCTCLLTFPLLSPSFHRAIIWRVSAATPAPVPSSSLSSSSSPHCCAADLSILKLEVSAAKQHFFVNARAIM